MDVTIDMALYGWYDDTSDTPAHDPGVSVPCAVCRRTMVSAEKNIVTISTLPAELGDERRSYFFRAHNYCWDAATEANQQELETAPFARSRRERDCKPPPPPRTKRIRRMSEATKPLCIYHGNCADGFTAAWAVWKRFGDAWDYHAGIYQDPPPDVAGRDVVLVDFSYKREVMRAMRGHGRDKARSVLVLDHHKSAAEDLSVREGNFCINIGEWTGPITWERHMENAMLDGNEGAVDSVYCLFDMNRSGAGIAWDFFHPGAKRPRLVDYVEDRDLWRFVKAGSREFSAWLFSYNYSFEIWEGLVRRAENFDEIVAIAAEGGAIERKHHKDVAELTAALKRRMTIGGHEVWAASLPYTLTSDAGHLMAKGEPFAACYWDTPEGRVFSLRSTDEGLDVSEIAKLYGGGGHRNASGFRLPHGVDPQSTLSPSPRDGETKTGMGK